MWLPVGHPDMIGARRFLAMAAALPDDCPSRRPDPDEAGWGVVEELLAQLVELTSLKLAGKGLENPIWLPRPGQPLTTPAVAGRTAAPSTPGKQVTVGLGPATAAMMEWAERNGPDRFLTPQQKAARAEGGEK